MLPKVFITRAADVLAAEGIVVVVGLGGSGCQPLAAAVLGKAAAEGLLVHVGVSAVTAPAALEAAGRQGGALIIAGTEEVASHMLAGARRRARPLLVLTCRRERRGGVVGVSVSGGPAPV
jgi:hypothetical protein